MPLLDSWRRQLGRERERLADVQRAITRLEKKIAAAERHARRREG